VPERATALVGHTGFVGSELARSGDFTAGFRSTTIAGIADRAWDEVVCAGMPAEKWRANQDPEGDAAALERLWEPLSHVRTARFVLISTVDVYEHPEDRTEEAPADATQPYGRHRAELERRVAATFEESLVVRLPALFGPGLKKNALYDLLHGRPSPAPKEARFQWYDLERLSADLEHLALLRLSLVNLVPEPVSMGDVAAHCFPNATWQADRPAARYALRTRHADELGGGEGFLHDARTSLEEIARFVSRVEAGEVTCASPSP
jgi:nucleoside-diphosphate-sugar epimerase